MTKETAAKRKTLGVCYYPEHWPRDTWKQDARRMFDLGIRIVRIGEFAWSRLEPQRNDYQFEWLSEAIDILHQAGLSIVLGTPTATPPKWLVNEMPDMLPVSAIGKVREFGSRRHYTFSHEGYKKECARIVTKLAEQFGNHPGIIAWQTDNEYDCHDTTLSFSKVDLIAFQAWLSEKYKTTDALNTAWGNVFWSMEVHKFEDIVLPNQTLTEANPAHWMDYRRFASDQVAAFNKLQCEIIRKHAPHHDIIHNFMGRTLTFDHYEVGNDLDISSWDSYPLGFLEDRSDRSEGFKREFARAGDPDFQAFHHDLYRSTSKSRWWVMEQQPGPVNWAPHNPAPQQGMVRLWTLEAFAHGAETVSYFRWRQAPFAQEQMHSGLLQTNSKEADGFKEVSQVAEELQEIDWPETVTAEVAILLDYPSAWAWETQPQGKEFNYFRLVYDYYKALRQLGVTVDFLSAKTTDFSAYKLVIIPGLFTFSSPLVEALKRFEGQLIIGPRSGSKTNDFTIPDELPPALPKSLLDIEVDRVETLRPDSPIKTNTGNFQFWREFVTVGKDVETVIESSDRCPAIIKQQRCSYLCGWPDEAMAASLLKEECELAGISMMSLPEGLRCLQNGNKVFVFNYSSASVDLSDSMPGKVLYGTACLLPSGFAIFQRTSS